MAAAVDVANLSVIVSANTKALQDGLNRVSAAVDQMTAATTKSSTQASAAMDRLGKAANVTAGLISGLFAGFTASAALSELKKVHQAYLDIGEAARRLQMDAGRVASIVNVAGQNGVDSKAATSGLTALGARANTEFRNKEGELTALLEANNLKITDQQGGLKNINMLLEDAARLVQNAATEFDKVDIARLFGLSDEWVKLLEKGPDALRKSINAAEEAGGVLDRELVRKAQEFEKAWADAMASLAGVSKSVVLEIVNNFATGAEAIRKSLAMIGRMGMMSQDDPYAKAMFDGRGAIDRMVGRPDSALTMPLPAELQGGLFVSVKPRRTVIPTGGGGRGGGGGGGGETSEAERAADRLEKYHQSLQRTHAVEQARLATFGQSNAAQKAAMEIARAMPDLNRLDAAAKTEMIRKLTEEVSAIEATRLALEAKKRAVDSINEAAKGMADVFASAFEDLALNGAKAEDVFKSLAKTIASSALRGLLTGEGMFGGVFGAKGVDGKPGGLLGGLFGSLFSGFAVPKLASGTSFVPGDMLAQIHKGEMVVPAYDAARMREGGGARSIVINQTIQANGDRSIMAAVRQAAASAVAQSERGALGRMRVAELRAG